MQYAIATACVEGASTEAVRLRKLFEPVSPRLRRYPHHLWFDPRKARPIVAGCVAL